MSNACLLCGALSVKTVMSEWRLGGVTSDSKPWPRTGTITCCSVCGHVQKQLDKEWHADAAQIYAGYEVHSIAGGEEQMLFSEKGEPQARSLMVATTITKELRLPAIGRLLDVGCGTGGFLRQFHKLRPKWELCGQEIANHFQATVLSVPGVCAFYKSLDGIKEKFDLITMNDVLEHLVDPVTTLGILRSLLRPGGVLFARSPHFPDNPFDLLIVDHCSHFTHANIQFLLRQSGFSMLNSHGDWLPKETAFLAVQSEVGFGQLSQATLGQNERCCRETMEWLSALPDFVRRGASGKSLGIFGTSIAGSWLASVMPGEIRFFADEDPLRQGAMHLGIPVISPEAIPTGSIVVLAFPLRVATALCHRLEARYPVADFLLPTGNIL